MLIPDAERDALFKKEIAQCINKSRLDVSQLFRRIRQEPQYTNFGAAFKVLARNQVRRSPLQLRGDRELAVGSDAAALWFITYVLDLIPLASASGIVEFNVLRPAAKEQFVCALDQAADLGNNIPAEDLAAAEVESVCCSDGRFARRIGKQSDSRLGDLLLRGSDEDSTFVLDQLDRLHRKKLTVYDSCYSQLLQARLAARSAQLRSRIGKVIRRIERDNPSATLPILSRDISLAIQSGAAPLKQFGAGVKLRKLSSRDICALALGVAESLDESGKREVATQILGIASQYTGSDAKLRAWVGIALGDTGNAARALFEYGLKSRMAHPMFDRIERYHAVEAACRLLFRAEAAVARNEYQLQTDRYKAAGAKELAHTIQTWRGALEGFETYLELRIGQAREKKAQAFNQGELRSSQRYCANLEFFLGIRGDFRKHLKRGISWFEQSAVGIEAPWIEGERLLLKAVNASLLVLRVSQTGKGWRGLCSSVEKDFVKAGDLLRSPYPLTVSLAFRGISQSRDTVNPVSIRDLTLAIGMLDPKTPELLELREQIAAARWFMIEAFAARKRLGVRRTLRVWSKIARLVPLLSAVIDEDVRLREHFSPAHHVELSCPETLDVAQLVSVGDRNERGRLLEDFIVSMVNSSHGLRVVDVRHRNNYEEIDIIVSITKHNPLLSHWGPLLLIECKNWSSKVGTDPVRAFYTKMTTKKGAVRLGIIISPSGFTAGVRELSRVFQDALIVAIGPNELQQATTHNGSLVSILEKLIPDTLFG